MSYLSVLQVPVQLKVPKAAAAGVKTDQPLRLGFSTPVLRG